MKKISALPLQKTLLAALLAALTSLVSAEGYQYEVSASASIDSQFKNNTDDPNLEEEPDTWSVGGKYYFESVASEEGPYAQAAFISRASSINVTFRKNAFFEDVHDRNGYQVGFVGVREEGGYYVEGSFQETEFGNNNLHDFSLSVGKYIADTMLLKVTHSKDKLANIGIARGWEDGASSDQVAVGLDMLFMSEGVSLMLSPKIALVDVDGTVDGVKSTETDAIDLGLQATVYPTDSIGLNIGIGKTDLHLLDIKTFNMGVEYFALDSLSFFVTYSNEDYRLNDYTSEEKLYKAGTTIRF